MKLDAKTTALVLIDLQQGILPFAKGPYSAGRRDQCWPGRTLS